MVMWEFEAKEKDSKFQQIDLNYTSLALRPECKFFAFIFVSFLWNSESVFSFLISGWFMFFKFYFSV